MEKVSLVRRRRHDQPDDLIHSGCDRPFDPGMYTIGDKRLPGQPFIEEFDVQNGHFVNITMDEEQSKMLQNSQYIKKLIEGSITNPAVKVKLNTCGRVVLRFSVTEPHLRMIQSDQVCRILQISRSFLQKLIHSGSLKSYKIGRLRRFVMEDILDYLICHEDHGSSNTATDSGPIPVGS